MKPYRALKAWALQSFVLATILSIPGLAMGAQQEGESEVVFSASLATPTYSPEPPAFAVVKAAYIVSYALTQTDGTQLKSLTLINNVMARWENGTRIVWRDSSSPLQFQANPPAMKPMQFVADVKMPDNLEDRRAWNVTATFKVRWYVPDVTVSVSPRSATIEAGRQVQFSATVGNTSDSSVTWAVSGGAPSGVVTSAGLYTAPQAVGVFSVVATSNWSLTHGAQARAEATVNVTAPTVRVSGLRAVPGLGQVLVTWTTEIDATTELSYGTTEACEARTANNALFTTSHSAAFTGLSAGTKYYFCAKSVGRLGGIGVGMLASKTADGNGVYSPLLHVPYCPVATHPVSACDSGALLVGKSATEPNAPNALSAGVCPGEEPSDDPASLLIKQITVNTLDGTEFGPGKRVKATVWVQPAQTAFSVDPCPFCDQLDLHYMPDHVYESPAWQYLTTLQYPTDSTWQSTTPVPLTVEFTMGTGSRHALRANFRNTSEYYYGWNTQYPRTCSVGHGDHDDLVFHVEAEPTPPCSPNMQLDPNNCGACGAFCQSGGPNMSSGCFAGACYLTCNSGYYDCNGNPSDGCESTDPTCGAAPACIPSGDPCSDFADCCSGYCYYGRGYSVCE